MPCTWLHCNITIVYFPRNVLPVMHINEQSGKQKQAFDISKRLSTLCQQQKVSHRKPAFSQQRTFHRRRRCQIKTVNCSRKGQNYVLMHCLKFRKKWTWCSYHIKYVTLYYGKAPSAYVMFIRQSLKPPRVVAGQNNLSHDLLHRTNVRFTNTSKTQFKKTKKRNWNSYFVLQHRYRTHVSDVKIWNILFPPPLK